MCTHAFVPFIDSISVCYSPMFSAICLSADWPAEQKHIQSTVLLPYPASART